MVKKIVRTLNLGRKFIDCPHCGRVQCKRHSTVSRKLKDACSSGQLTLVVYHSKHYCPDCDKYFSMRLETLAPRNGRYTHRVRDIAINYVFGHDMTLEDASKAFRKEHNLKIAISTMHDWLINYHKRNRK